MGWTVIRHVSLLLRASTRYKKNKAILKALKQQQLNIFPHKQKGHKEKAFSAHGPETCMLNIKYQRIY